MPTLPPLRTPSITVPATELVARLHAVGPIPVAELAPELDYLRATQRPSGAFLRRPGERDIVPYWGNYAAIGLGVVASRVPEAATMGWRWLDWYAAQQDPKTGFVYDHVAINTKEQSTGLHDSTDAYAATFLVAVESMFEGTGCFECVVRLRVAIRRAFTAIAATQDVDGLTWAQPKGRVKYLMDQAEVGAGLRSGDRLLRSIGDEEFLATATSMRQRHDDGLRSMIGLNGAPMVFAISESHEVAAAFGLPSASVIVDEARLYPDALSPIVVAALLPEFNAAVGSSAVARYTANWPRWTEDPETWGFPVLVAWALNHVGDYSAANAGALALHSQLVGGYRGAALTVGHIGQLLAIAA